MISNEELKKLKGMKYVYRLGYMVNKTFFTQEVTDIDINGNIIIFNFLNGCVTVERKFISYEKGIYGEKIYTLYDNKANVSYGKIVENI